VRRVVGRGNIYVYINLSRRAARYKNYLCVFGRLSRLISFAIPALYRDAHRKYIRTAKGLTRKGGFVWCVCERRRRTQFARQRPHAALLGIEIRNYLARPSKKEFVVQVLGRFSPKSCFPARFCVAEMQNRTRWETSKLHMSYSSLHEP
jgi:hypothetical protein